MNDEAAKIDPNEQLELIAKTYLNNVNGRYNVYEMEAKFGTRNIGFKPISKIDYDNVIRKLKSAGYHSSNEEGAYSLRIQPEFLDAKTGKYKTTSDFDRFRIEINGLENIMEYCNTNDLSIIESNDPANVSIMRKSNVYDKKNKPKVGNPPGVPPENEEPGKVVQSANFDDFNFRVTLKNEEGINKNGKVGEEIFSKWNSTKKVFRYINRVRFTSPNGCFAVELSIVKSSSKNERGWMTKVYNVDESNVFKNPETYEIEIEALNKAKELFNSPPALINAFQAIIKHVLCGLQKTNYPVSYVEQRDVFKSYQRLLFEEEFKKRDEPFVPKDKPYSSDFIGPNLVTLGLQNVSPVTQDMYVPNITEPFAFCVTEKADGERGLLYVNEKGRIYIINTNWNIIFTGAVTEEPKCFNSLLDGELILYNSFNHFINKYAAFDIYYINNIDVRARPFVNTHSKDEKYFKDGCRLPMMKEFIKLLKPISVVIRKNNVKGVSPIKIVSKTFYPNFDTTNTNIDQNENENDTIKYNIFQATRYILQRIADAEFEYAVDGLIYTPTLFGVGSNKMLEAGPKKKITWESCFKWKPSEATKIFPTSYNTIDFLVSTKKGPDGKDIVTPIFEKGINNADTTQYNQYKTLILAVGFDTNKHGYINPCQDLLDDKYVSSKDLNEEGYKPKQFFPSNPYDPLAGLCNVMLQQDENGAYTMFTEENEPFDDKMVVEFRYDASKPGLWKWIPMRVRYDKTIEFKNGNGVGANDYNTANNNWNSIHYPVTEEMLATGQNIPNFEVSDDVYYNSVTADKLTKGMRDFHNLYVKKALIQGVSKKGNILIDLSCGKAGDLPKWIAAELSFVLGIDISKDNIENRVNGACARYLNFRKTMKNMPYALFVNGNSALNIRSGTNMFTDKSNEIIKTVFGSTKNTTLGSAVTRQHGKGHNGFDVCSCQFSLHYMFENKKIFYNFIRNVAECTKLYGYFIATCYDGMTIFNLLKNKQVGQSSEIFVNDKKVWSVTKLYDATTLEDNENCLGLKIDAYQDSINQTLPEYLVNFDFLTSTMEKYGFALVNRDEARHMGLPDGSGMFSSLHHSMMSEVKRNPKKEADYKEAIYMKDYEVDISFLNRYFVYKKVATRNVDKLTKTLLNQLPDQVDYEMEATELAQEAVREAEELIKPKAKKLNDKLKLVEATEAIEPDINEPNAVIEEEEILVELPKPKSKKTTRKKKVLPIELVIEEDDEA